MRTHPQVFLPAAVLEGGCGFVDLPGLNDVDSSCLQQTRDGVKDASVVFVVTAKTLQEDKGTVELMKEVSLFRRALLPLGDGGVEIIFICNRELDQHLRFDEIGKEREEKNCRDIEARTRDEWRENLEEVNDKLKKWEANLALTDDKVAEIVAKTQVRVIYPMTHTAFKVNIELAEHEAAHSVFKASNVYCATYVRTCDLAQYCSNMGPPLAHGCTWLNAEPAPIVSGLLGQLDALNRDGYVRDFYRICTRTLPELRNKLQTDLDDGGPRQPRTHTPERLSAPTSRSLRSAQHLPGGRRAGGAGADG